MMRGKLFWLTCTIILFFGGNTLADAQSVFGKNAKLKGLSLLEVGKALTQMPEAGAKPEDFVPPHWKITTRAEGDLNSDGVKDYAFALELDTDDAKYIDALKKLDEDDSWIFDAAIVVVIDSRGDKRLHINSLNHDLPGNNGADERGGLQLEIKKNVLNVNLNFGGSYRTDATFHFREEPQTGGSLRLIGFDVEHYCVSCTDESAKWRTSENYLTNTRVETTYKIQGDKYIGTDKQIRIREVEVNFENIRLNSSNGKDEWRPF
jgi:hypothetical protein